MTLFSEDDIFLVTGASSGIGRRIALSLHAQGATVIINGRSRERLEKTMSMAGPEARMVIAERDLATEMNSLPAWLASLAKDYGRLRGFVGSAGITLNAPMSYYDMDRAHHLFDICCHAPLKLGGSFCGPRINAGPGSAIVFVAAAAAENPNPGQGMYAAAKGALVSGAKCLAKEAALRGVRVNCVSPGLVMGPMMDATVKQLGPEFLEKEAAQYPLGIGEPQNVADLTIFLLSEKASWITGQNIILTGGR